MTEAEKPLVTICIPHWQVRELVSLCLRAIRKFTPAAPIEVMVVDNGSKDDSLDYLRTLSWIRLIERGEYIPANGGDMFTTSLDLGLAHCQSEFFLVMHTDTLIKREGWLERLLRPMQEDPTCGVVGSGKLIAPQPVYHFLKKVTDTKKARLWFKRILLGNDTPTPHDLYPRDYCALYRVEPLRYFGLRFNDNEGPYQGYRTAQRMYCQLRDRGYRAEMIPMPEMLGYMDHITHATAALQPALRRLEGWRRQKRVERKVRRLLNTPMMRELAASDHLDYHPQPHRIGYE